MEKTTDKGEQMTPPKGYKHTELGVLPEDWEVVRLGDIGKIVGGGTPSTKKVEFWSGTIPWISSSDIDENSVFDISQTRYITQEAISKSSTKPIEPNSILIVSRVGLGKVAVNQNILCTSQDIQALTQHKQNAFFLVYAIKNLVSLACRINQGTSIKGFTKEVLSNLCIPLPPLAEQEKIAEILSTWDTQIQNFETLVVEKQALKKGLCQTLLTAKTRLKGFSGDWEVVRLGDVADFFSGGTPKTTERKYYGGEIPFIKSAEIYNSTTQEYLTQLGFKESSAKWVKKGDLLYALYGANSGEVAISKIDGVINQAILCIKNQPEVLNTYFLYSVFLEKKEWITTRFLQGGQGNLSGKIVQNLQIPLPPLAEQKKIAEILSGADNEITLLEQKLESLKSQKRGLMQNLLNGKVRVK